jgi:hypothetical protein
MATQLRGLDDIENINAYLEQNKFPPFGKVVQGDGTTTYLYFRDLTNKVIHAERFEWALSDPKNPKIICHAKPTDRWQNAEIDLIKLMGFIGTLAH